GSWRDSTRANRATAAGTATTTVSAASITSCRRGPSVGSHAGVTWRAYPCIPPLARSLDLTSLRARRSGGDCEHEPARKHEPRDRERRVDSRERHLADPVEGSSRQDLARVAEKRDLRENLTDHELAGEQRRDRRATRPDHCREPDRQRAPQRASPKQRHG